MKNAAASRVAPAAPDAAERRAVAEAEAKGGTETVFGGKKKAVPAAEFLDTVGVGVHWGYADTPYGIQYSAVRDKLVESGIRHMRTGVMAPVEPARNQ